MTLKAEVCGHLSVAIAQLPVCCIVALCPRDQCAQFQAPDVIQNDSGFDLHCAHPVDRRLSLLDIAVGAPLEQRLEKHTARQRDEYHAAFIDLFLHHCTRQLDGPPSTSPRNYRYRATKTSIIGIAVLQFGSRTAIYRICPSNSSAYSRGSPSRCKSAK